MTIIKAHACEKPTAWDGDPGDAFVCDVCGSRWTLIVVSEDRFMWARDTFRTEEGKNVEHEAIKVAIAVITHKKIGEDAVRTCPECGDKFPDHEPECSEGARETAEVKDTQAEEAEQ